MSDDLRILILEDVPTDAELVERELRRAGIAFVSERVDTRDAFLAELLEFAPDLVLSDYMMPKFNGMEALELVKERFPSIPLVIVTGSMNEETAVECLKAGAADYVIKERLVRLGPAVKGVLAENRVAEEKRKAQEGMRAAARAWRATFDAMRDAVSLLDAEGRVLRCNTAMSDLLGKSWEEIIGSHCCELLHGKHEHTNRCPYVHMCGSQQREGMLLARNDRWFDVTVDPMLDEAGKLIGVVHTMRDITERTRSQERYRALFESSRDAIMILEPPAWRFTSGNPACIKMFGLQSEAELISVTPWELSPERQPDGRPSAAKAKDVIETAMSQGSHLFEWRHRRIDGREFPATVLLTRVQLGGQAFVQATVRDITALKEAEEGLRASERRYRALFEGATEGILVADVETHAFRYANPAICRLLGYSEQEMLRLGVQDIYPSESLPQALAMVEAQVRGDMTLEREVPCRRKDGTVVHADINMAPVEIDARPCAVGFFTDATERELLEEQLRQSQKLEAIGQLAGGVAHDFNNLLTGIKGYTALALDEMEQGTQVYSDLTEVCQLSDRAADLTRQLLAFSRKQPLRPEVIDLNELVEDTAKMLGRLIGEDVELELSPTRPLDRVCVDPGQIEQVLMNLAINARDAMPNGGKLTIETANVTLDQEYVKHRIQVEPGAYVMVAVSDTGCGMDAETQQRLFEPFFTTKGVGKSTGLGLATVYGIVKQHNGHIWVYSEPGAGTTFKVYLPRAAATAPAAGPPPEVKPAPGGSETILLVEDEPTVIEIAQRSLTASGYQVFTAASPAQAEELFEKHGDRIDLLVTDVVMPGSSGRQLYECLASKAPELKVLYMSGYTDNAILHHGVLAEGIAFMEKPFDSNVLLRKVREVLDGS